MDQMNNNGQNFQNGPANQSGQFNPNQQVNPNQQFPPNQQFNNQQYNPNYQNGQYYQNPQMSAPQAPPKKSTAKVIGWGAVALLAFLVAVGAQVVAGFVVAAIVMARLTMEGITPDVSEYMESYMSVVSEYTALSVFLAQFFMFLIFIVWYFVGCRKPAINGVSKKLDGKGLLVIFGCYISSMFFSYGFSLIASELFPAQNEDLINTFSAEGVLSVLMLYVSIVVLAPLGEEFIFRGVITHYLKRMTSDVDNRRVAFWIVNITQAFLFGVLHFNLIQGIYAFVLGLIIGVVNERYHSILPGILMHFLQNTTSTVLGGFLQNLIPESMIVYFILIIIGLAASTTILVISSKSYKESVA